MLTSTSPNRSGHQSKAKDSLAKDSLAKDSLAKDSLAKDSPAKGMANAATRQKRALSQRLAAATLAVTSLLAAPAASYAQQIARPTIRPDDVAQACFAVADNGASNGSTSGAEAQDFLVRINSVAANSVSLVNPIVTDDGTPVTFVEAMTSRPDFGELIVADENRIGRVDPATGVFTLLGTLTSSSDFDAIVIELIGTENRLLAVSKGNNPNVLVEVILDVDPATNQAVGILSESAGPTLTNFPAGTGSIDGIALSPDGTLLGIANNGASSPQKLVIIDEATGVLTELGDFVDGAGVIPDVEDISFDLGGNLFASSGSNNLRFQDNGFFVPLSANDGTPLPVTDVIALGQDGGTDFEASSCLRPQGDVVDGPGDLILVKRITAVTRDGEETRFNDFVDQAGETDDNTLRDLITARFPNQGANFPAGVLQSPTRLETGDEVEYTVYVYNPSLAIVNNAVLCDPIQPPGILNSESVGFSAPSSNLNLSFVQNASFARAPLSAAPADCSGVIAGSDADRQFPSGPPGPTGGLDEGAGGGIVTNSFNVGPDQLSALRFNITVGEVEDTAAVPE
ncbi:MAG: hypothetical protein AAGJ80_00460 [Cyanobacteria bacterium J06553_1]